MFDKQWYCKEKLDSTQHAALILFLHRVIVRPLIYFAATRESASQIIKMTACDASAVLVMQEYPAVCIENADNDKY